MLSFSFINFGPSNEDLGDDHVNDVNDDAFVMTPSLDLQRLRRVSISRSIISLMTMDRTWLSGSPMLKITNRKEKYCQYHILHVRENYKQKVCDKINS